VSDRAGPIDDATMKFGLLMESAQAQQKLAETHLERLRAHTQDLDDVVRDSIRRALVEELRGITAESQRAAQALRAVKRSANVRSLLFGLTTAVVSTVVPLAAIRLLVPSAEQIDRLRSKRDQLAESVEQLAQRGGRIEWRRCGETGRLCVRVDRSAPSYGDKGDYAVVKGY